MRTRIRQVRAALGEAGTAGTLDLTPLLAPARHVRDAAADQGPDPGAARGPRHLHGRLGPHQRRRADHGQPAQVHRRAGGSDCWGHRQTWTGSRSSKGSGLSCRPLTGAATGARSTRSRRTAVLWERHPSHDRWQEPVFRAFFDDALAQGRRAGDRRQGERRADRLVALPGFCDRPEEDGVLEIGWSLPRPAVLGPRLQRRVQAADARARVRAASTGVLFRVGADNVISRKAMANIGGPPDRRDLRGSSAPGAWSSTWCSRSPARASRRGRWPDARRAAPGAPVAALQHEVGPLEVDQPGQADREVRPSRRRWCRPRRTCSRLSWT